MSFDPVPPSTPDPTPPASTFAPTFIEQETVPDPTLAPTEDQSQNNSNDDPTIPPSNEGNTNSLTGNLGAVGAGGASASVNASMVAMIATLCVAAVAVMAALAVRHQVKKKNASDRSHGSADSDFSSVVSLSGREEL